MDRGGRKYRYLEELEEDGNLLDAYQQRWDKTIRYFWTKFSLFSFSLNLLLIILPLYQNLNYVIKFLIENVNICQECIDFQSFSYGRLFCYHKICSKLYLMNKFSLILSSQLILMLAFHL